MSTAIKSSVVGRSFLFLLFVATMAFCCFAKTTYAQQQELSDALAIELFDSPVYEMSDMMALQLVSHPLFESHLNTILSDLQNFDFDVEADEELMNYMATLSDADAKFFRRAFRGISRGFRRIGGIIRKVGSGVGKFVKKYGKIIAPIALTALTGGLGGFSLAGSLGSLGSIGSGIAKGAALLSKASAILGKGQAILGGLNAVTGGKSKFLGKALNFVNKVSGVVGKGSMFLNAGSGLVGNLSNLSKVGLKGIASQFKPSELFKGANIFQKGQNFLTKASGLIGKGQNFASQLNTLTGGKVKFLRNTVNVLDKAQKFAGIGTDALSGLQGGFNSLKNLKNLKGADFKKLLTSNNLKSALGRIDTGIAKTRDIVGRINDVTGGRSKGINKLLGALDKGQLVVGAGNTAIDRYQGIKGSLKNLKNFKTADLKKLLTSEGLQKGISKLTNTLSQGQDLLTKVNAINGGKSKTLNNLIAKLGKGQEALGIASNVVDKYQGIRGSIKNLKNFKTADLKKLLTSEGLQKGISKLTNTLSQGQDLLTKVHSFNGGKSKKLGNLIAKFGKGQEALGIASNVVDRYQGIKTTIKDLKGLKKADLKKLLTVEGIQGALGRIGNGLQKGQDLAAKLNTFTEGRSKTLAKLVKNLEKGQKIVGLSSSVVDGANGIRGSLKDLKNLKKSDINIDNVQTMFSNLAKGFAKGKDIATQLNEITGGKNKGVLRAIDFLNKGEKVTDVGATVADRLKGVATTVRDLSKLKKGDLDNLLTAENIEKAFERIGSAVEKGQELKAKIDDLKATLKPNVEEQPTEEPEQPVEQPVEQPTEQPTAPVEQPEAVSQPEPDVNEIVDPVLASQASG